MSKLSRSTSAVIVYLSISLGGEVAYNSPESVAILAWQGIESSLSVQGCVVIHVRIPIQRLTIEQFEAAPHLVDSFICSRR